MTSTTDLRFDEEVINVSLAEEYLKINSEFHSKGYEDNGEIEYDVYKNQIYLSNFKKSIFEFGLFTSLHNNSTNYLDLAEKLTKNIDLICQLEYLLRKKPMEEVRNFDMKLLEQNLIYQNSYRTAEKAYILDIVMTADTSLASLGCIAQSSALNVTIQSTKETAVICSLFVNLCHEAGLDNIKLIFMANPAPETPLECMNFSNMKELRTGCVGIITEKADIDSAVHTFLYATSQYPWHFKKIFVQECALNRFKKSLEWKTKKPSGDVEEQLVRACTSVHVYEGKLYLFEYAGDVNNVSHNSIIIEAYRTNKELMSIMATIKPFCVSLWSSHVSESNEIAFGLETNIVWINDYGCFEGPPVTSQAFYSLLHRHLDKERMTGFPVKDVLKIRETWLKLEMSTRLVKMSKVADKFMNHFKDEQCFRINSNNSNISVGNKLCIATREPVNVIVVNITTCRSVYDLMNFIVDGGAVVLILENNASEINEISKLYQALKDIGAPVLLADGKDYNLVKIQKDQLKYNTKVVWASIGTIFAN
ncbi:uncharacterized protein LOC126775168 [Nymphalis io]|uniref:uncharacterized protein LOC126775168 n=1 Tax=Inachis io TaxID=171585 RepID=UPI00216A252F|nr:uncharacterized protein LOC126775168 [Nymphalis io]XP_050352925.1 uncharacterized protein LOC126775168 [Nymphalis io]XP_050352926.1 uncharacterized protein LOC126775168 [Nymphalis io]XP_050352927.1 uncharacterized protein LOC126775168 [Nymphalis io]